MIERGPRTLRVPRGRTAGILALGGLGLVLVLVLVASASGPVDFFTAERSTATRTPSTATPSLMTLTRPRSSASTGVPANFDPPALPSFVRPLLQVLVWAAILLVLVLLVRGLWRHVPRWRSRRLAQRDVAVLPDVPEELTRSADARMALLGQGSPRNAIVACWLDLEEAAAKVGLPRARAETSAEYTTRVLATWDIAPDALSALAELYREARFSRHDLTEERRSSAIARLTTLHDDLRRIADERAAARAAARASEDGRPGGTVADLTGGDIGAGAARRAAGGTP